MKLQYLLIAFFIGHSFNAYSGGWTCYRCKVEIKTANRLIEGYVQFGDDFRDYFDKDLEKYINDHYKYPRDTISIYDTIYSVEYPRFKSYKMTAISKDNTIKIPVNEIEGIRLVFMRPCQDWLDERNEENDEHYYAWVGHTMPVMELTKDEIELLNTEPEAIRNFRDPLSEYSTYWIISYSKEISNSDIEKIFIDYKSRILNYSDPAPKYIYYGQEYRNLKNTLRDRRIIVFRIGYAA